MEVVLLMVRRDHVMACEVFFLLLFFVVGTVLTLASHVRVASDLLERFVATG